ncbi:hypothetical protein BIS33_37 [Klebsiella phage vB_KpnP_BIS33]|uniref:Uncharacterized protein n=2 Tax=Przondovirus TaxID=1985720 RepID=A0A2H4ZCT4_9CAUD|nr:hypothetical protein HOR32_gp37 [Klebsiella phage vB_KpnP_BIS33]AUF73728.1 hypothetical protein BIS33_37 [Klebsiella phage vB_KpnP_BIS33]CAK6596719.1 unknown function [Klebsiella phage vB_Kpn_K27PH129C1]
MATGQLILIVLTMGLSARGLWMLALIIKQIVEHKSE